MTTAEKRSTKGHANGAENFEAIYPGSAQKLTSDSGQHVSAAFGAKTSLIRVFATNDCYIDIGTNPSAANDGTSTFVPGGIVDFFACSPGDKIAVTRFASDGYLFVTEAK